MRPRRRGSLAPASGRVGRSAEFGGRLWRHLSGNREQLHADRIEAPVLIAQGLEDKVVPPAQAEAIVEALERNNMPHLYVPLEGEGHGFRRRESRIRVAATSVSFHAQVFGFEPADDVERVEITGL